jgi:hypothetical protein
VKLPNLRLAARCEWNFAFFWHAEKVAQSLLKGISRGRSKGCPWCRIWFEEWKSKRKYYSQKPLYA